MTRESESKLQSIWWALRLTFGLIPFLAGLDKFLNILTDWAQYQSPIVQHLLPISTTTFMHIVGVIEMIVGIGILTRWTRVASYTASVWLVAISANLLMTGRYFDVAVRDLAMALGAYTLGSLTEILDEAASNEVPSAGKETNAVRVHA